MKKLAIITTHPIQYYAPVFKLLYERAHIAIHVFYTWGKDSREKYDPGFKREVNWDIPLLDGYDFSWMNNTAKDPGSHHFNGIKNPELISSIKNYHPDALLVIGWAYHSHLKAIRYFKGKIPVYFRGDSTLLDNKPGIRSFLRYLFLRWVYSHISHAFYAGKNNKAYFKKYGLKEHQLHFAPHVVDNDRFAADHSAEVEKLKSILGIAEADFVILFAGKFEPKKDPLLLLEAFSQINRRDIHLIFAGNGVLEEELKAKSQKLKANIHFLPFQNQLQMPALYQACDVLCLPSKGPGETWGLVVNEAMAAGRAVIVSDKTGCAADLIVSGETGFVHQAQQTNSLAKMLRLALSDKAALKQMGKNARKKIGNYSLHHVVQVLERTYENSCIAAGKERG